MTYPNQPGNNGGGRNNRPNPFNPFGDNSNKPRNNGGPNGNNNAPRSFWQRPWLYIVLIVLILFFILGLPRKQHADDQHAGWHEHPQQLVPATWSRPP